jgi:hypothetical protein
MGDTEQGMEEIPEYSSRESDPTPFFVVRHGFTFPERFASFSAAYSHALNRFCDEGFTVWNEAWEDAGH